MKEKPFFSPDVKYESRKFRAAWRGAQGILSEGEGLLLDIGSGGDSYRKFVEEKGYKWIGADLSPLKGVKLVADAHSIPFKDETFSAILASFALQYFREPHVALDEMHRVLRNEGVVTGVVSSCEVFHDSYFSFTHWGLEHVLKKAGFTEIEIFPGAPVFLLSNYYLFKRLKMEKLAGIFTSSCLSLFFFIQGFVFWTLNLIKAPFRLMATGNSGLKKSLESQEEYKKSFPYRFSGHLLFRAKKQA